MNRQVREKACSIAVLFTIIGLVVGLSMLPGLNLHARAAAEESPVSPVSKEAIDILSKMNRAMAEVAAAVKPAVVNISTTRTIKTQGIPGPFFNDPFFREFFGGSFGNARQPREYKQASLGSGVIVSKKGYILTNNHVVKDADEIRIRLSDGRELKGKVIGTDQKTDIAVIKIDTDRLPVVKLGDSDRLRVGEQVFAVGNPFGLNQTVTTGIVSATGRANVGIADYEDFIQTDAPINPGNSGGALINIRGELVGINTAIFSTSGGYQGVGFAIPSNMAKGVMEALIRHGKVVRGWLGISVQPLTPEIARQFALNGERGALVNDVMEGSPAQKAGMERGDIVVEYDGKAVNDPAQFRNVAAATPIGKEVAVLLLRNGKPKTLKVTIVELPSTPQQMQSSFADQVKGIHVQDIPAEVRSSLRIPGRVTGVIVTDVEEGAPAAGILMRNDVIMEIDRHKITNAKEYGLAAAHIKPDQAVLLLVYREGSVLYLTLPAQQ
ncbi:MAG: DegQ family serine endoprotease [Nitrospirales bacterium]|nr:DegQ family serine endoprotease [Nitrospirales bacterium]